MRHLALSEENLEIMREVWARREATVKTVWAALNASRKKQVRKTTVEVQMRRLERYGWLGRRKSGREFIYWALWGRDETVADLLRSLRRRLFDGSYAEMVRVLLADGSVPPAERKRIRGLVREPASPLDRGVPPGPSKKLDFIQKTGFHTPLE